MRLKEMKVSKLIEHPENAKLFRDIKDTDPAFWLEFVNSIKTFGIIEPLIANQVTMQVRSGNQRLKAALEAGLETVPVLLVDPETDTDGEIQKMIVSNVFRRTINPFAMFEYIGRLRGSGKSVESTRVEVKKRDTFVSAADIYNAWTPEQKAAIDEWYDSKKERDGKVAEGELTAMIRAAEAQYEEATEKLAASQDELRDLEDEFKEAEKEKREAEEEAQKLRERVDELDLEVDELRNADYATELDERDAQINKLLEAQTKLKGKIKELKDTPDINFYLIEAVKKQKEINSILKPIVENAGTLNPGKVKELEDALTRTFEIIKKGTNHNGQNDRRELLT